MKTSLQLELYLKATSWWHLHSRLRHDMNYTCNAVQDLPTQCRGLHEIHTHLKTKGNYKLLFKTLTLMRIGYIYLLKI